MNFQGENVGKSLRKQSMNQSIVRMFFALIVGAALCLTTAQSVALIRASQGIVMLYG